MLLSCFIKLSVYKGNSYRLLKLLLHTKNHIIRDRKNFSFETHSKKLFQFTFIVIIPVFSWKNERVLHPCVLNTKPCENHLFYLGKTETDQTSHMVKSPDLKVNGNWKQELL